MIKMISDEPSIKKGFREATFLYDPHTDEEMLDKLLQFLSDNQPVCDNCQNMKFEPESNGYRAKSCTIHGNIEAYDNPHHDKDGSKCSDYKRIECSV